MTIQLRRIAIFLELISELIGRKLRILKKKKKKKKIKAVLPKPLINVSLEAYTQSLDVPPFVPHINPTTFFIAHLHHFLVCPCASTKSNLLN